MNTDNRTVGVIVGRFQVDELHEGHRMLVNEVRKVHHDNILFVVGTGPLPTTRRKPLPFETRRSLILEHYPDAEVVELRDHPDDYVWSQHLDQTIRSHFTAELYTAKLYCSRDSFKDHYTGDFPVIELEEADLGVSGTLRRELIAQEPGHTAEFAQGVIWANCNKFPTVYSVVDMAVTTDNHSLLLLITKNHLDGYMFPGGFCDVGSPSDEHDASREVLEETGLVIPEDSWTYLGSRKITDDWRYAGEDDEMRTRLLQARYFGHDLPTPGDDAATANFYSIDYLDVPDFHPNHRPLFELLLAERDKWK